MEDPIFITLEYYRLEESVLYWLVKLKSFPQTLLYWFCRVNWHIRRTSVWCVRICMRRGGLMVTALYTGSSGPDPCQAGQGHCVVFLSTTHFILTVPFPNLVYKCVPVNLMLCDEVSTPSQGEQKYPRSLSLETQNMEVLQPRVTSNTGKKMLANKTHTAVGVFRVLTYCFNVWFSGGKEIGMNARFVVLIPWLKVTLRRLFNLLYITLTRKTAAWKKFIYLELLKVFFKMSTRKSKLTVL